MKQLTPSKRLFTGLILSTLLILSMGMSVWAATASTSFIYNSKTVQCILVVDWKVGKDEGYAKTYVSGGSGTYPLGAYCNAYKDGTLLGGKNITAFDTAKTGTVKYTADEFRSSHNIQNSNRVSKKSTKLSLTD